MRRSTIQSLPPGLDNEAKIANVGCRSWRQRLAGRTYTCPCPEDAGPENLSIYTPGTVFTTIHFIWKFQTGLISLECFITVCCKYLPVINTPFQARCEENKVLWIQPQNSKSVLFQPEPSHSLDELSRCGQGTIHWWKSPITGTISM
jgi:hypothetical protein